MTEIDAPPLPPLRSDRAGYPAKTENWILWEKNSLYPQMNAVIAEVNANTVICQAGADAATVAIASSHYKGLWSALTGALAPPACVKHLGQYWLLSSALADVTAKVPGTATEWELVKTVSALPYFQLSGSITAGQPVAINSNGTVSLPAITAQAVGTPATYTQGNYPIVAFDATAGKGVVVYKNANGASPNVTRLEGQVITANGLGLSYGAPANATTYAIDTGILSAVYNAAANRVVAIYKRTSDGYGYAVVGTVSGTSILWGNPAAFTSAQVYLEHGHQISYDSVSGKVVIAYRVAATGYATAIVGTVSGTDISFGLPEPLISSGTSSSPAVVFDASTGKHLFCYADGSALVGKVGAVSGTSISVGGAVILDGTCATAGNARPALCYDSKKKQIFVAYIDSGSSSYGTAIIGKIYGATFVPSTIPVQFCTAATSNITAVYDAMADVVTTFFVDGGNSSYGTFVSGSVASGYYAIGAKTVFLSCTPTTISAVYCSTLGAIIVAWDALCAAISNYRTSAAAYIGIAQDTATNAPVRVATAQWVDENQAGLATGSKYYLTDAGALTLTETLNFAGTAVGSTKLLVKG